MTKEKRSILEKIVMGAVIGAAVGSVIGAAVTPNDGKQNRKTLKEKMKGFFQRKAKISDQVADNSRETRSLWQKMFNLKKKQDEQRVVDKKD